MKSINAICYVLACAVFIFLQSHFVKAQEWDPIVELVSTGERCYDPKIAVEGEHIHLVWEDFRAGSQQIYYKRSLDQGRHWDPGKLVSVYDYSAMSPTIAVWENNIHIAYRRSWISDESDIFYTRSTDGGETFSDPILISNMITHYINPHISVFQDQVHICWSQYGKFPELIVNYSHSMDNGENWSAPIPLSGPGLISIIPIVKSQGPFIYIVWEEEDPVNSQIMFIRSEDHGNIWTPPVSLLHTNMSDSHFDFEIEDENRLHLVYQDGIAGSIAELYHLLSEDRGITWSPKGKISFDDYGMSDPFIDASKGILHVTWSGISYSEVQINYIRSENGGEDWTEQLAISDSKASSGFVAVGADGKNVFVAWVDWYYLYSNIYFRRSMDYESIWEHSGNKESPITLYQNSPNPFDLKTSIAFKLNEPAAITLEVYSSAGHEIASIPVGYFSVGNNIVEWDASELPPGTYFYCLTCNSRGKTVKTPAEKMIIK